MEQVQKKTVLISGASGEVGSYAALFLARLGVVDKIYLVSRHAGNLDTIRYNAQVSATMCGFDTIVEVIGADLTNLDNTAEVLAKLKPDIILNCAAAMSLFPYFPSMRKRQKRMNMIPGFAHTLPKDIVILYPLMLAVKQALPHCIVVNLAAPDLAGPLLYNMGLAPDIGAGTLDSTSQGIKLAIAKRQCILPNEVTVRMVAHHAIRRFPSSKVPFALDIYVDGKEISNEFSTQELQSFVNYATDITGVETMDTPVTNNASITAASVVETAKAIILDKGIIRHGSGVLGMPGGAPTQINYDTLTPVFPNGIDFAKATEINTVGMKMDGLDHVKSNGTAVFTESEVYWIKESLGLDWRECPLKDAADMCVELKAAYKRMDEEEKSRI